MQGQTCRSWRCTGKSRQVHAPTQPFYFTAADYKGVCVGSSELARGGHLYKNHEINVCTQVGATGLLAKGVTQGTAPREHPETVRMQRGPGVSRIRRIRGGKQGVVANRIGLQLGVSQGQGMGGRDPRHHSTKTIRHEVR